MAGEKLTQELEALDKKSLTTVILNGMDFVIPGSYHNTNSLEEMVKIVTGDVRVGRLQAIANHVEQLYEADSGASRAVWLYKVTDKADKAVAAASMANKLGSRFGMLKFLTKVTPQADTAQTVDLCLKLTVEALAHLSLHGLSKDALGDWVGSLQGETYSNESALRLAAIVGLDGLIPLGPDFLAKVTDMTSKGKLPFSDNALFKKVAEHIPGSGEKEKASFVGELMNKASQPLEGFIARTGLTREKVVGVIKNVTDVSDDKLDYVAAFLDASTSFVSHTGVQSVARHLVDKAGARFGYDEAEAPR